MDIYFNKIHDPVSGAEVADMHRATEAASPAGKKTAQTAVSTAIG
jgi:hypothetical protein